MHIIHCVSAYIYECISLFVSKVVHASQINATQTLTRTHSHTHTHHISPNGTISIISICNKCPRAEFSLAQSMYIRDIFVCLLLFNLRSKLSNNNNRSNRINNTNVLICIRFGSKPNFWEEIKKVLNRFINEIVALSYCGCCCCCCCRC